MAQRSTGDDEMIATSDTVDQSFSPQYTWNSYSELNNVELRDPVPSGKTLNSSQGTFGSDVWGTEQSLEATAKWPKALTDLQAEIEAQHNYTCYLNTLEVITRTTSFLTKLPLSRVDKAHTQRLSAVSKDLTKIAAILGQL